MHPTPHRIATLVTALLAIQLAPVAVASNHDPQDTTRNLCGAWPPEGESLQGLCARFETS